MGSPDSVSAWCRPRPPGPFAVQGPKRRHDREGRPAGGEVQVPIVVGGQRRRLRPLWAPAADDRHVESAGPPARSWPRRACRAREWLTWPPRGTSSPAPHRKGPPRPPVGGALTSPVARELRPQPHGFWGRVRVASPAWCSWCCALKDGLHLVDHRDRLLDRLGGVHLYRVPLHEAALEGEVPDGINVVRLDDREDDVVRAEDAQRADVDAELLGELRDLAGTLLQHLARLSIGGWAEIGQMLGDDGECCHDVSVLLSVVEARVAAAYFANLSSRFL